MQGLRLGMFSGDLEWFNNINTIAEGYLDIQRQSTTYDNQNTSGQNYHLGGNVYWYGYSWFLGGGVQGSAITRSGFVDGTNWSAGAFGHIGLNLDIGGAELFLQPNGSYSYHFMTRGNEVFYRGVNLQSKEVQASQLKAGAEIIKIYSDQWHGRVGGYFIQDAVNAPAFYAGGEKLPLFEQKANGEIVAGIDYLAERWAAAAQLNVFVGDNSGVSVDVQISF